MELYSRGSQYVSFTLFTLGGSLMLAGGSAGGHRHLHGLLLALPAVVLLLCQGGLAIALNKQALDHYLGLRGAPGRRLTLGLVAVSVALLSYVVVLQAVRVLSLVMVSETVMFSLALLTGPLSLLMPIRRTVWVCALAVAVVSVAVGVSGSGVRASAAALFMGTVGCGSFGFSSRGCGWILSVMRELERARDLQGQLAVAEERLRFGRDLHDVLGRNLSVIALKSELAVQLARRERPEAVEQMIEVQRIARESQGEVRDVVRGYRTADLHTELAGALSVLRAAGVDCQVHGDDASALPAEAQSVLAWVVREGTTNVLRHGDAGHCAIRLRACPDGAAVLTMENDGVEDRPPGKGNGLDGLRERLTVVDGTLAAERRAGGTFRLTAEVPPVAEPGAERAHGEFATGRAG
ncbi:sensor histidine kinase [Streptantibioticus ferralitis]|uniref:Histidine kinase n=1 Tax=Streptantibioticus ferralitis TaxID=236510 RepID=A0ABT5Z7W1_9ACTN|nr:histidine kinase [Streptantibioticus ferralitis]MDF2259911.1 histidine kinase [Streptantibioticus ferralitis]